MAAGRVRNPRAKPKARAHANRRILVTSALPYVNNIPHLGNIIGCVLSADVFARFCRSRGDDVLYICGTDEHGTTTEAKALEEGVSPREICDKYYALHKEVYDWLSISFDHFGRTSAPVHHTITQDIFKTLHKNGCILPKKVEQSYCPKDERFLADRFVEGACPKCHFPDARGDQCDSCGKLLTPQELVHPRCKLCGSRPVQKESEHLFLDLAKLQPKLETWFAAQAERGKWPENARTVTRGWLKEGLQPRAITRDLSWGVKVPLKGFERKVFYVWFDAPIGYISITADHTKGWKRWWQSSDVRLYQFMAKDNIPFHTILFPATLLGTKKKWTMLHHISSVEYLNYESGKFSKSRNVGVFGNDVMSLGFPADAWRYYLLVNRPEKADTVFLWDDFAEKLNSELAANIGNFVNRVLSFLNRYAESVVPSAVPDRRGEAFWHEVQEREARVTALLDAVRLKEALKEVMALSKTGNGFFQESEPWKHIKELSRAGPALRLLTHLVKDLAVLSEPFLPQTSARIFSQLNLSARTWDDLGKLSIPEGHAIGAAEPLFAPVEPEAVVELRERFAGAKESLFSKLDLRVCRVLEVKDHPEADKLYILTIDLGSEKRQLVAGLKQHYTLEQLAGKSLIVVANLKPAKLRGVYSQGMLLAAEDGREVEALHPDAPPGTRVGLAGNVPTGKPAELSFEDFIRIPLSVKNGVALAEGKPLTANGKEVRLTRVKEGKVR